MQRDELTRFLLDVQTNLEKTLDHVKQQVGILKTANPEPADRDNLEQITLPAIYTLSRESDNSVEAFLPILPSAAPIENTGPDTVRHAWGDSRPDTKRDSPSHTTPSIENVQPDTISRAWGETNSKLDLLQSGMTQRSFPTDPGTCNRDVVMTESVKKLQRRTELSSWALRPVHPDASRASCIDEEPAKDGKPIRRAVFADAEAMKNKLREALSNPQYNVADFYHKTGIAQHVATSPVFENSTLFVIVLNAFWIFIDTDYNDAEILWNAEPIFIVVENLFCAYFLFEWMVRFLAFEQKSNTGKDAWFVFDSILMALMAGETWLLNIFLWMIGADKSSNPLGNASILKLIRLLRLTRMARLARVLRAMPELMVLVKGMASATRSVFLTICLLVAIIYIFGIAFVQLMRDTEAGQTYFDNVPNAMNSLLMHCTLPDQEPIVKLVGEENFACRLIILLYIGLATLTILNMLIGVLCEVVSVVSAVEKESLLLNYVKARLQMMLTTSGLDADHDCMISRLEFQALLQNRIAIKALTDVGVDVVGLVDFTDFIFADDKNLTFPEFMEIVLSLRGSNMATVKDIVDVRKLLMNEMAKVEDMIAELKADLVKAMRLTTWASTTRPLTSQ